VDPETKRVLCWVCSTVAPVQEAKKTTKHGLKPSNNLYESFFNPNNPDSRYTYQYDLFISYRHVAEDRMIAEKLADSLTAKDLRTFFAPKSLWMENIFDKKGDWPTRWIRELKNALSKSAHFIVIITREFFESTYCELELRSIYQINRNNPNRKFWIKIPNSPVIQLPRELQGKTGCANSETLSIEIKHEVERARLLLGRNQVEPLDIFPLLPLTSHAWGDGLRHDIDPTYQEFENIVRELLLLLMRGIKICDINFVFPPKWNEGHIKEAHSEALNLAKKRIFPYPTSTAIDQLKESFKATFEAMQFLDHTDSTDIESEQNDVMPYKEWRSESWYTLVDYGGKGYPQDMDWVCRKCQNAEGVGNPNNPPIECSNCGYKGE
jgi:hypothetical protein